METDPFADLEFRIFQSLKVSLQFGPIDYVQVVRYWLARPRDGALKRRHFTDVHDGPDITQISVSYPKV